MKSASVNTLIPIYLERLLTVQSSTSSKAGINTDNHV